MSILNYTLRLTALEPLFIGSGEQLDKSEYIFNPTSNKFYVMDKTKMFNGLNRRGLIDRFTRAIMTTRNFSLYNFCRENNIPNDEYIEWAKYSYIIPEGANFRNTPIHTIIKDSYGLPYVPGSSVKGALRNAVLNSVLLNSNNEYNDFANRAENEPFSKRNRYLSRVAEELDIRAFHTRNRPNTKPKDAVNSIFAGLRIGDSKPLDLNDIVLCPKLDRRPNGSYNEINIHRECLAPDTVVELPVEIDTSIFPYDAERLCKCIHDMYNMEVNRFLSKFSGFQKEDDIVLYLGGGSGFLSKTAVYSLYKDDKKALNFASKILDNVDSIKKDGSKVGNHLKDPQRYGVSPHMWKRTVCGDYEGDFGLCQVEFEQI